MFTRTYTGKGEDVNDFMIMQNFAYLTYSSKILEAFLLEKGFSKLKKLFHRSNTNTLIMYHPLRTFNLHKTKSIQILQAITYFS